MTLRLPTGQRETPAERERLLERLRHQGPEDVSAAAVDLTPDEISAWLAAKNGH